MAPGVGWGTPIPAAPTYREFAPAPALAPFVECFWRVTTATAEPAWLALPDGCLDIVFRPQGGRRAVGATTRAQRASIPAGGSVAGERRGWAHPAAQCGYYDQAHPIREFGGYSPAEYAAQAVFSNSAAGPALYDGRYETDARSDRGRDREVAAVLG